MAIAHPPTDRGKELVSQVGIGRTAVGIEAGGVGQLISVVAPVGGVHVDEQVGVPAVDEPGGAPGFGGLHFDVVAIEIETLPVGPEAHSSRSVLTGPVLLHRSEPFVAIHVVNRHHQQDHAVEQRP